MYNTSNIKNMKSIPTYFLSYETETNQLNLINELIFEITILTTIISSGIYNKFRKMFLNLNVWMKK